MRHLEALVLWSTAATSVLASDSSRPRGVGPEFAKFYKTPEVFTCITNPSITLPLSALNDNYCDCPDGSDEPGTSACSYLSPLSPPQPLPGTPSGTTNTTPALPGFYCKNKGHMPAYAPFDYVNDGVCDYAYCCDGSDEWEHVGGVHCEDRCAAMGKEWKKAEAEREKGHVAAMRKRRELVAEAERLRIGVADRIRDLEVEIEALQVKAEDAKRKLEETERMERGRVVKGASKKASRVTVLAALAKRRVEELRNGLETAIVKKEEVKGRIRELEDILKTFKEEYNPNFNDEGVKRAVKAWEDYAAKGLPAIDETSAEERDLDEIIKPDTEETGINWAEWEAEEEESDVEAIYRFEAYLPTSVRDWLHNKLHDFRTFLVSNGMLADHSTPGSESKAITAARDTYTSVTADVTNKQNELSEKQADLSKDYGPDNVFRALKDTCVSQDSGEYTYELCWLSKTTQISKKGGGHTNMGNFNRFERIMVDEEEGKDGRGLGKGERLVMIYEGGQHCWNGPQRSTVVVLKCWEREEVWKVVEAEKCVYRMEVGTPAVCEGGAGAKKKEGGKDEL